MTGSTDSFDVARALVLRGDLPLAEELGRARTELLDLSARNRLLNVPRLSKAAKTVEVVGAKSAEVSQALIRDDRPMTFHPDKPEEGEGRGGRGRGHRRRRTHR